MCIYILWIDTGKLTLALVRQLLVKFGLDRLDTVPDSSWQIHNKECIVQSFVMSFPFARLIGFVFLSVQLFIVSSLTVFHDIMVLEP